MSIDRRVYVRIGSLITDRSATSCCVLLSQGVTDLDGRVSGLETTVSEIIPAVNEAAANALAAANDADAAQAAADASAATAISAAATADAAQVSAEAAAADAEAAAESTMRFLLPAAVDPTTRDDLSPLQDGDQYLNVGGVIPDAREYFDGDWRSLNHEASWHANFAAFPVTGDIEIIYIDKSLGALWQWNGAAYTSLGASVSAQADATVGGTVIVAAATTSLDFTGALSATKTIDCVNIKDGATVHVFSTNGITAITLAGTGRTFTGNLSGLPAGGVATITRNGTVIHGNKGGLDAIPAMTMLGNNTVGTAVPVAMTQAQVKAFAKPNRLSFEDTAPGTANVVTGVGSMAFGSGHDIDSDDVQVIGGTTVVTNRLTSNTGKVFVAASSAITLEALHFGVVLASTTCSVGMLSSGSGTDASCNNNAVIGCIGLTYNPAAGTVNGDRNVFMGMPSGSFTGQGDENAYFCAAVTDTSSADNKFVGPSGAAVTFSGATCSNSFVSSVSTSQTVSQQNTIVIGYGGMTINGTGSTSLNSHNGVLGARCVAISSDSSDASGTNTAVIACDSADLSGDGAVGLGAATQNSSGKRALIKPGKGPASGGGGIPTTTESNADIRLTNIANDLNSGFWSRTVDMLCGVKTTDATATKLHKPLEEGVTAIIERNIAGASGFHHLVIEAEILGVKSDGTVACRRLIKATFRGAYNATATQVGATTLINEHSDAGAAAWVTEFVAETVTKFGISVRVTGAAATTIYWTAEVKAVHLRHL